MAWPCLGSLLPAFGLQHAKASHHSKTCLGEPHGGLLGCRLANAHAAEIKKLGVRGTLANGVAKVESVKAAHPPPVWFVFSGAQLHCCTCRPS